VDNIEIDLREVGWGDVAWIGQDREWWRALMNAIMNLRLL
jgi:hypothetical protein